MPTDRIGVLGTGSYVPDDIVTNDVLAPRAGVTSEWIAGRTGIRSRRFAASHQATSDLAVQAGRWALERAGIAPGQVDYLIVATSTPDSPQPPTSYHVQHGLGAVEAACFDINVACSGFVYGLAIAHSLVAQRPGSHVLVVAADVCSRVLDFADRRTAVLMGDGAGAAVIGEAPSQSGFLDFALASRGDAARLIQVTAGGSRRPTSEETLAQGGHFLRMEGRGVVDFLLRAFPPFLDALLRRTGLSVEQIDHFVPHQPNGPLLTRLVERSGLDGAHTHRTLEHYGNTAAASVPLTLDTACQAGLIAEGDLVLLAGFGSGMSMSATIVRWGVTP